MKKSWFFKSRMPFETCGKQSKIKVQYRICRKTGFSNQGCHLKHMENGVNKSRI
jgi:hypothetical protein